MATPRFSLRFPITQVPEIAARYSYPDDRLVQAIGERAKANGSYERAEFLAVCRWKTPRSSRLCAENQSDTVGRVTRLALAQDTDEATRIGVHLDLKGVGWPTASVLLHFGARDPYPILDFRALWSLGYDRSPHYSFRFRQAYVAECRRLSGLAGISMRTLDRALWQYSKEHSPLLTLPLRQGGLSETTADGVRHRSHSRAISLVGRTPIFRRFARQ
jgi:hypothetical protein